MRQSLGVALTSRAHLGTTTKSARKRSAACVRSTSRSGTARPRVLGSFGDFGHPHLLRLVLRTQPRSGGGSKMRPCSVVSGQLTPKPTHYSPKNNRPATSNDQQPLPTDNGQLTTG